MLSFSNNTSTLINSPETFLLNAGSMSIYPWLILRDIRPLCKYFVLDPWDKHGEGHTFPWVTKEVFKYPDIFLRNIKISKTRVGKSIHVLTKTVKSEKLYCLHNRMSSAFWDKHGRETIFTELYHQAKAVLIKTLWPIKLRDTTIGK